MFIVPTFNVTPNNFYVVEATHSERCTLEDLYSYYYYIIIAIIIIAIIIIGERAKQARHSQVCSIENRIYIIIIMVRANFVLITRKEGGA